MHALCISVTIVEHLFHDLPDSHCGDVECARKAAVAASPRAREYRSLLQCSGKITKNKNKEFNRKGKRKEPRDRIQPSFRECLVTRASLGSGPKDKESALPLLLRLRVAICMFLLRIWLSKDRLVEPRVCEETALAAMAFRDIPAVGYIASYGAQNPTGLSPYSR